MSYVLQTINDTSGEKKVRNVDIYKNLVYKDIELHTFKHVDASGSQDVVVRNAVAADPAEGVDSAVIARFVAFRDAKLRNILQFALVEEPQAYADDGLDLVDDRFRYWMKLPSNFRDSTLQALAEYMHRFLVFGALYDWYSQMGMTQQASVYGSQLQELEDEISSILRGPSIAKRPMQPFGPAEKFK